ncbi:DEAD/DEAH box helicase [Methylophilus sp. 14]|uniref:DEAD/DEAH box helicase n=1 Tax=Methylophilus sp. 14 TaxID=2781019 RepID=UPI00188E5800|nr:DEAD/DEAH box helicase [Methylophilus sp. 14]MBF4988802.1 DEAD/DEAH box helicase [Methylophilus sp. 14]
MTSLKRLESEFTSHKIYVPFTDKSQITILQSLRDLLEKFDLPYRQSNSINNELRSYSNELQQFEAFSTLAKQIRNNEFNDNVDLVNHFDNFQAVLSKSLVRKLYPLQLLSAFHLAFSQNACNFAVPGAGKTSIVYGAYAYLKSLDQNNSCHVDKLMVIGPLSSFAPWEKEYKECFGQFASVQRMSGDLTISKEKKLQHLYAATPHEVSLISHAGVDILLNDIIEFLKRNKTMLVVDEAHRIKNPDGIWGKSITEISKYATARVILTGTPVPNGFQDIYNLMKFIYPFKHKEVIGFHYQNLVDMTNETDLESPRIQQLKRNLSPYFIRIKKDDLQLPPVTENNVFVNMNPIQRQLYDQIESKYIKSFKKDSSATFMDMVNKAKLIRLRQASSNPLLLAKPLIGALEENDLNGDIDPNTRYTKNNEIFIDDAEFLRNILNYYTLETPVKFQKTLEILLGKIIPNKEKCIVWTIFIQNAKDLQTYLLTNEINAKLLIGEVEQKEREIIIDSFNDPKNLDFQVVIANPFAVAESISLHKGCHNAIYLERDYNCSNFLQSKDRIHRVGLEKDQVTNYYYLISRDSIDEVITQKLQIKINQMNEIINDDIPLFSRIDESDETDIITALLDNYAARV